MAIFNYKAINQEGKIIEDIIKAYDKNQAALSLKSKGLKIITIKTSGSSRSFFNGSISTVEKATFCRFISTMLKSGLPLSEAIEIIKDETKNPRMKKILTDISFQTLKGESLSSVLSLYKNDFDSVFTTMVRAGEESGSLDESFEHLAKQLLSTYELTQKIKGALAYPIVIIFAMLVNAVVMMVFVLPMIAGVFLKLKVDLPWYTRLLLGFGDFVGKNVALVLSTLFITIVLSIFLILRKRTRDIFMSILIKFSAVKKLVYQIDIVRFSRTLSTLLKRGVPITNALDVAADSLSQPQLSRQAKQFSLGVSRGESLSSIIVKENIEFPSIMIQTIKAGEKTGSLEEVLAELAEFYEREVDYNLKKITALLEPVLMLIIGLVVGVMVIIIIAPIYSIIGGLQSSIGQK